MKKIYIILIFTCFVFGNNFAQTTNLVDFETKATTEYGATFEITQNTDTTGLDPTLYCGKIGRTTGNWYELVNIPCNFLIPANDTMYIHMLVKYPAQPDMSLRLNMDDAHDTRPNAFYSNTGEWQDLVFKKTGGDSGLVINNLRLLPDVGYENNPAGQVLNNSDNFGYIDNIILSNDSTPRQIGTHVVAIDSVDFEPKETTEYGATFEIVDNTDNGGLDKSLKCGKIGRTTSNWYELVNIPCSFSIPANDTMYIHMLVKYPAQPDMSLRLNMDDAHDTRPNAFYSNIGEWQDLVFEKTGGDSGLDVNNLRLLTDVGYNNNPAGQVLDNSSNFGYIDEIMVSKDATPRTIATAVPEIQKTEDYLLYAQQNTIHFSSKSNTLSKVYVYDIRGTLLKKFNTSSFNYSVPCSGIYIVKVDNEARKIAVY